MRFPSAVVVMLCAYSAVLLTIAWLVDHMGKRSAARAASWRTGNFIYHDDQDAWKCHQDEWLYPVAFDPDKRVIRYQGQHEICGRCPIKDECSPSPGPREITRMVDPWPHSEAGRFHRGIALVIAVIALFLPVGMLFGAPGVGDVIVLAATAAVVTIIGVVPLGRHLRQTPANFPMHIVAEASSQIVEKPLVKGSPASPVALDSVVDRYATRWASERRRVDDAADHDDRGAADAATSQTTVVNTRSGG